MKKIVFVILLILLLTACSNEKFKNKAGNPKYTDMPEPADYSEIMNKPEVIGEMDETETSELEDNNYDKKIIKPIKYSVTRKINPSMPEFTFVLKGNNVKDKSMYYSDLEDITSIVISSENGDYQQTLKVSAEFPNEIPQATKFSLDDWNFDGYLDIRLLESIGGSMGNEPSYFWLWDNDKKQFVENTQLEEISEDNWLDIYKNSKQVVAHNRCGAYETFISYYGYSNGKYLLMKQEDIKHEED